MLPVGSAASSPLVRVHVQCIYGLFVRTADVGQFSPTIPKNSLLSPGRIGRRCLMIYCNVKILLGLLYFDEMVPRMRGRRWGKAKELQNLLSPLLLDYRKHPMSFQL
jgi:hypothetical protein